MQAVVLREQPLSMLEANNSPPACEPLDDPQLLADLGEGVEAIAQILVR